MAEENLEQITLQYTYKQANYHDWLEDFAKTLGTGIKKNTLLFPPAVGTGFSSSLQIENGFSCCIQNYHLNKAVEFERISKDDFGLLIHFYHFKFESPIEYRLQGSAENAREKEQFVLRLINASAAQHVKFHKGTSVKGLSIYLDNKWIQQNLSDGIIEIIKYIEKINYLKENIHSKYQKLLFEIINITDTHPYPLIYIKSRVLRLMDVIFENLLKKDISEATEKISEQDFEMIQKVELALTEKFTAPFPSIERLARVSLMSESKLKKLFKQAFGVGMYEYYQQNRLHKAKEMILLNKHTVTEVGKILGYQNLSNFSVAFKKEFNCLPSEISRLN